MTKIYEQVGADWKEAMKSRDPRKDVLSLIRTELKNKAINTRTTGSESLLVPDEMALDVLMKMAKQRKESIEQYQAAARQDLADKEAFELSVIEHYLPKALSKEELQAEIEDVLSSFPNPTQKDMGKVMGLLMVRLKGRAQGGDIQALVKERLE